MTTDSGMKPDTWIACDESGNTGENVTQGAVGVFSEGSHDLSLEESEEVVAWLKAELRSQAGELKWKQVRKADLLLDELFGHRLHGRGMFYLTEKLYFAVGKVIDLLLEQYAHEHDRDLYAGHHARKLAFRLYREGERALGAEMWRTLLQSFNSLIRVDTRNQQLKGVPKATVSEFFEILEAARWRAKRKNVEQILVALLKTRAQADEFGQALSADQAMLPTLDPLIPSLAQTIREWYERGGSQPIHVVHDAGPIPSSGAMDLMIDGLRHPGEFRSMVRPVQVAEIVVVKSHQDARVQVADLIAGFGADVGLRSLSGRATDREFELARGFISPTSLWADSESARSFRLEV